ncbi:hypothetical protein IPL68_00455 [Candidatus Saccharibacteria bacterium]|nr:MAG: hypothetical protein IPL68_00455 [Candidatus Saccharibacteria bacterium]
MEPTNPSQLTNSTNGTEPAVPATVTTSDDAPSPQQQTVSNPAVGPEASSSVSTPQVSAPVVNGNPIVGSVESSPVSGGTPTGGGKKNGLYLH